MLFIFVFFLMFSFENWFVLIALKTFVYIGIFLSMQISVLYDKLHFKGVWAIAPKDNCLPENFPQGQLPPDNYFPDNCPRIIAPEDNFSPEYYLR